MKIFLVLTAAALASTAAIAQTPTDPAAQSMQPGMSAPTAPMPADTSSASTGSTTTAAADMMTERDGKWYVGDRPATKAEIKAHKKMMKTPS